MTPAQCRAGRALVGMSLAKLAQAAGVPVSTVADLEEGVLFMAPHADLGAIRRALQEAGVEFTGFGEYAGVRLKDGR